MPNLMQLEADKNRILADVIEKYGEVDEEQSEALDTLSKDITQKVNSYLYLLQEKGLEELSDRLKGKVNEIKKEIEKISVVKEHIEYNLHQWLQDQGGQVKVNTGAGERYITADFSVRRSVDINQLAKPEKQYKIKLPRLSASQFDEISSYLELGSTIDSYDFDVDVPVTELPENHPAIIKSVRPKVKITKGRPKQ